MAYVLSNDFPRHDLGGRVAALKQDLGRRIARHRVYRRTFDELNALSDRDLADLGVGRSDVRPLAVEAAHGA